MFDLEFIDCVAAAVAVTFVAAWTVIQVGIWLFLPYRKPGPCHACQRREARP